MDFYAKIIDGNITAIGGELVTRAQLGIAVDEFNSKPTINLVYFQDGYSPTGLNLNRVAAQASLELLDNNVIATLSLYDTPMGKVAHQLALVGALQVKPITEIVPNTYGPESLRRLLHIRQLLFPKHATDNMHTPAKQMKAWVNQEDYWPLYDVRSHKY